MVKAGAKKIRLLGMIVGAVAMASGAHAAAWEPTKPVEFVIPAGPGGGADQMARLIQGIVAKHNLMKQSLIPVNKSAGAGALQCAQCEAARPAPPFFFSLLGRCDGPIVAICV